MSATSESPTRRGAPSQAGSASEAREPRHRIGAVVERTGLTEHTIRVWERRYDAVSPERTSGGTRLYTEADIQRLGLLGRLTQQGHAISALAKLASDQLTALAGLAGDGVGSAPEGRTQAVGPNGTEYAEAFLVALEALDTPACAEILLRASSRLSPRALALELVAPLAQEVGQRWRAGCLTIAQEHAATASLRDLLAHLRRDYATLRNDSVLVAATLTGEKHELGLLVATLLATMEGWQVVYLGTELPAAEVVDAVRRTGARLVLISSVIESGVETRAVLRELRAELPSSVEIIVGGRAAPDVPGVFRPSSMVEFENKLRSL